MESGLGIVQADLPGTSYCHSFVYFLLFLLQDFLREIIINFLCFQVGGAEARQ